MAVPIKSGECGTSSNRLRVASAEQMLKAYKHLGILSQSVPCTRPEVVDSANVLSFGEAHEDGEHAHTHVAGCLGDVTYPSEGAPVH